MMMALNRWFHAGRSGRGAEAFTHLKRNYSLDALWSNSWEWDGGTWESWNRSQAVPGRDMAGRYRLRPNCAESCHYGSLVSFSSAENGGNTKTNWVPLNKNPEYPKCRMEAWIIPASSWTMYDGEGDCLSLRGIHDYFSAQTKDNCFGHFIITMQYLATILKNLPCLCKWALPFLKHWWNLILNEQQKVREEQNHYSCECC